MNFFSFNIFLFNSNIQNIKYIIEKYCIKRNSVWPWKEPIRTNLFICRKWPQICVASVCLENQWLCSQAKKTKYLITTISKNLNYVAAAQRKIDEMTRPFFLIVFLTKRIPSSGKIAILFCPAVLALFHKCMHNVSSWFYMLIVRDCDMKNDFHKKVIGIFVLFIFLSIPRVYLSLSGCVYFTK